MLYQFKYKNKSLPNTMFLSDEITHDNKRIRSPWKFFY